MCYLLCHLLIMEFVHFTFDDSSRGMPHFEVNAFYEGRWVGHYQRRGDWIHNVFVADEMRGRGMCQKMLRHAIKQKKKLRLLVMADNIAAQRCYSKLGFKEIGRRGDAIEMLRDKK